MCRRQAREVRLWEIESDMSRRDLLIAPALEAALIAVVALAGWASHQPLVFSSLGPTAYEMIETPERLSARPYNIIVGHLIGVIAGFSMVWIFHLWAVPVVSLDGVPLARVWAAMLATLLTVFGTLLARARQPAAISTSLLIALGVMQTAKDGVLIMAAVGLMTALGEPVRRWRRKDFGEGGG